MADENTALLDARSLRSLTIDSIQTSLENGDYSVEDLLDAHLAVVHRLNASAKAVIETNVGARQQLPSTHTSSGKEEPR
jgi:Asp-tRNA(Asn)/Glu-tRNA(Gln) amidotransferase A subunit family amidase